MQYPRLTKLHILYGIFLILISFQQGFSQINSPYSRYGMGDLYNSRNVANKGMGNLATPYYDFQSVNFINPASYSRLQAVTFDVGVEIETRKLIDPKVVNTYNSGNISFNYVALGLPLHKDKTGLTNWGMAFGLRPISKMNYKIEENSYLQGIDSTMTTYEGSGGLSQVFMGTGFRIKGFSLGVNIGYNFGQMEIGTLRSFLSDSVIYYQGQYLSQVSFKKLSVDAGFQYDIKLNKTTNLRLAANGYLGNKLSASTDVFRQTVTYNSGGGLDTVDVASREKNVRGKIQMPAGYTIGLMLEKTGYWMIGAEYEQTKWDDYRFYDQKSQVGNFSMLRIGGQFMPAGNKKPGTGKKYFSRVTYRAGFYTGKDYIIAGGEKLPLYAASIGFGLPVRRWNVYSNQYTTINTSFEMGRRGNSSQPLKENFFKLGIGLSLSDIWFYKRKFD